MREPPLELLRIAVTSLGLVTLGLALVVYFLMQIRHHRHLVREARRLMLANLLYPSWDTATLREVWRSSPRQDREILEEILVDHRMLLEGAEARAFEQAVIRSGIFEHWLNALRSRWAHHRLRVAGRLGFFHDARSVQALSQSAQDRVPEVALASAVSLGRLKDPAGLPALFKLAQQPLGLIPDLTLAAAMAACAQGCPGRLAACLATSVERARVITAWALSEVADSSVLKELRATANDPHPEVRARIARALARNLGQESVEILVALAHDPVWFVRVRAFDAIGRRNDLSVEHIVHAGLTDKVREVRFRAAWALRQLQGMSIDVAEPILERGTRREFNSLLSEWERAGFLWLVVGDLNPSDSCRYAAAQRFLRRLIGYGLSQALRDCVLVFPKMKVRLRLVRLLAESCAPQARAELRALAGRAECDPRVAAAIRARASQPDVGAANSRRTVTRS